MFISRMSLASGREVRTKDEAQRIAANKRRCADRELILTLYHFANHHF